MDRIGRVGREDHVARRGDGIGEAGEPFLRAHRHHDLALGIELDSEAAGVIIGLCAAQPRNALRLRIAVRVGLLRDLAQFVDDMLRRRLVGIAHAEIDDVLPRAACRVPHRVDFGDDIGRQALHAVEIGLHHSLSLLRHDCGPGPLRKS